MSGETTGRYLVLLQEEELNSGIRALTDSTGVSGVARAADFESHAFTSEELNSPRVSVFDRLGIAVVMLDPDQAQSVRSAAGTRQAILDIQPERIVRAIGQEVIRVDLSGEYLRGYKDATCHLYDRTVPHNSSPIYDELTRVAAFSDGSATWGLQATQVVDTSLSGLDIKVAVLDTGFDLTHPDFAGRKIVSKSFISGESVRDENGHGTHCIGTACGPKEPDNPPRYGIAYNAEIFVGKVLSNEGSGADGGILAGIEWAIDSGCHVVSMSLGAPTQPSDTFSPIYERIGKCALRNGTLIVAAAGNESRDPFTGRRRVPPNPVGYPANAPSLMAVAALDSQLDVASFSNGSINFDGGQVDIAGPGVDVYSTWPMPTRYRSISGTSMATPHVSGIAALYAEATGAKGMNLWGLLMREARRLPLSSADVGIGLVRAIAP